MNEEIKNELVEDVCNTSKSIVGGIIGKVLIVLRGTREYFVN